MDFQINSAAMDVALFCKLNTIHKTNIPIPYSEMGALIFISNSQQPVRPVELSNFFGISKPSATATVKKLIERGYLARKPSQIDGRSYVLFITPHGKQLLESVCAEYTKTIEKIRREMGDEAFASLLHLIQQANSVLKG